MEELERCGIFRSLGFRNFLAGDFFKWYLHIWDTGVAEAIRALLDRLKDYDPGTLEVSPEQARGLLKKLYHRLMPREIRHDLGEYYTPDWLAEHVLNELGYEGQPYKRLLDPDCGSGTFLGMAIKRLKERCFREGMNEQESLKTILKNIVGIDLNPRAVAARMLDLGNLLAHRTREIDIPVYLADSILMPARGQELFNQDHYALNTVVGQFGIPSCLKTREQIGNLYNLLEECVSNEVGAHDFLDRARRSLGLSDADWEGGVGRGEGAHKILRGLFNRLVKLHGDALDGIWARILQNAFMPLFLRQFDLIAGNPPWIGWGSLSEEYRGNAPARGPLRTFRSRRDEHHTRTRKERFVDTHELRGFRSLATPRATTWLRDTQTVFKTRGTGQGFRRFRFGTKDTDVLGVVQVHDLTDFQPFEGATNRTATFV